ncbi:dTDP-4-dehydrorhamnose reductase [Neorhizobium sp. 2083]|uniref:dTDP-4-dehydrorhamnose reductase n=1 Tax=Neorhizobium sp. 2083 TaxID=2817762 RepID=UPI0028669983|nr:dTDP-4-dehydrorhamnose reductase [Neorhizobium sp. 2083]MDR6816460.1 dTDP-4-dehydrorhamnose reductase [Neorhizobium sp. 2083]
MMHKPRRYVVTGFRGQVVQSLLENASSRSDVEIIPVGRPELDLAKPETIAATVEAARPDLIVSAAAFTGVDLAETDAATAISINADGPGELARVAATLRIPIIHLSTDYVFDGNKSSPYGESDPVAPLGVYGRSKLMGEQNVAAATEDHAILRTAWIYSSFSRNFLRTMLKIAATKEEVRIVEDQIGNPTSAIDIADTVIAVGQNLLASSDPAVRGIFHVAGTGAASWADFADEIFRISAANGGPSAKVIRIPTSEYPTLARRPANSQLDCSKLHKCHGIVMPDWQASTESVVRRALQPVTFKNRKFGG